MSAFDIALDYLQDEERSALTNPYHLTGSETDVARQLAAGRSASEISAALNLSGHGLRAHVERLFEKVGATGMPHLLHLLATMPGMCDEEMVVDIDDYRIAFGFGGTDRR